VVRRKATSVTLLAAATVAVLMAVSPTQADGRRPPGHRQRSSHAELNLVFVLDGLRPDSITAGQTPNLFRLRRRGVTFPHSHSMVPTVTRVNSAVLGTGNLPGHNGIVGNEAYLPSINAAEPTDVSLASELLKLRTAEGRIALTRTLGERLQSAHKRLVTLGSGTSGASLLLNPTAPDGTGVMINAGSDDGPRAFPASVGTEMQRRFGAPPESPGTSKVDYLINVLDNYVLTDLAPDVVMTWLTEPDASQHSDGVGSPAATAAIRNDDRNLGLVLAQLDHLGLAHRTNIMVVSDHGFSVINGVVNVARELVAAGLKQSPTSTDVVVANTGSTAIYVKHRRPARIKAISRFLLARDDVDNVFTAARKPRHGAYRRTSRTGRGLDHGWVDGTSSLELIGHASPARGADILVTFPWTARRNAFGVPGAATTSAGGSTPSGPRTGNASTHGSFSPFDVTNTFFGWGADFKHGVTSPVPAGNIDVTPTLLALEGLRHRGTDGRVLREALTGGPDPDRVGFTRRQVVVTNRDHTYRGQVTVSVVNGERYIDQARRDR
jgi:predicted AlkP superfamily pyrophosphatase or phosphodiesterase